MMFWSQPRQSQSTANYSPTSAFASTEPANLENAWTSLMGMRMVSGNAWTDAYLAAFAIEAGLRMITFDQGMRKWPGLALELLSQI